MAKRAAAKSATEFLFFEERKCAKGFMANKPSPRIFCIPPRGLLNIRLLHRAFSHGPAGIPEARAIHNPHRTGHSRTLYTSIVLDQSNFIFKEIWSRA